MRLFVAVDLTADAKAAIAAEQKRVAAALGESRSGLRLVKPDQIHVTLLFLGEVPDPRVSAVVEAMALDIDVPAFELVFGGAGVFPPRGAPRVLWIGVTAGTTSLARVQQIVAARARRLEIPFDDRPFNPHLTIGRWRGAGADRKSRVRLARPAASPSESRIASVWMTCATLYQSRLSSRGSEYTALAHATLSASP